MTSTLTAPLAPDVLMMDFKPIQAKIAQLIFYDVTAHHRGCNRCRWFPFLITISWKLFTLKSLVIFGAPISYLHIKLRCNVDVWVGEHKISDKGSNSTQILFYLELVGWPENADDKSLYINCCWWLVLRHMCHYCIRGLRCPCYNLMLWFST